MLKTEQFDSYQQFLRRNLLSFKFLPGHIPQRDVVLVQTDGGQPGDSGFENAQNVQQFGAEFKLALEQMSWDVGWMRCQAQIAQLTGQGLFEL